MKTNTYRHLPTSLAILAASAISAQGAILVYEGFNYGTASGSRAGADLLHGQADDPGVTDTDATGLGGTWSDSAGPGASSDLFLYSGSLGFKDLPTSGNSVRSDTNSNNDLFSRSITSSLSGTGDLWFSFTANKLQNNFNAAEGGIVIGNQAVNNSRVLDDNASTGLFGFGIAPDTVGDNWTPYAWNGTTEFPGDAVYTVPTDGSETNLLIGHVSFNTGGGGADVFTAYYYDKAASSVTADMGNLIALASALEVDLNESLLDTLSLTRQVNTAYDEIRIGESLDDVLGLTVIPEPSTFGLAALSGLLLLRRRRA